LVSLNGPELNMFWPNATRMNNTLASVARMASLPKPRLAMRFMRHPLLQERRIIQRRDNMDERQGEQYAAKGHMQDVPEGEQPARGCERMNLQHQAIVLVEHA